MDKNRTWVYCRVAHSCQNDEELLEGQRFLLESMNAHERKRAWIRDHWRVL